MLCALQEGVNDLVEQLRVAVVVPPPLEAAFRLVPRSAFLVSHAVSLAPHYIILTATVVMSSNKISSALVCAAFLSLKNFPTPTLYKQCMPALVM